eukprot:c14273_g1_i2.p1 GENE.c14273_g1_i2~~c14273_g1_i2.p1  ORF type:complete len:450 (+),score=119.63 c14273_g1_i2:230-1579(+)
MEWHELLVTFSGTLNPSGRLRSVSTSSNLSFFSLAVDNLRSEELMMIDIAKLHVLIDTRPLTRITSLWSLLQTMFVCLILIVFPYWFGRDVLRLVVTPLEEIIDGVRAIVINPFVNARVTRGLKKQRLFEIDMISIAINKLARLLQVGLGHAGGTIISHNLQSGTFSAMQRGCRINAVYAFCDIRNFTDSCEVLQTDCVSFVNSVAAVVADECTQTFGAINKNIGDAFLIVWRYCVGGGDLWPPQCESLNQAAFNALEACVGMIERVAQSPEIQAFAEPLKPRLGPNTTIRLGMGLHTGWAIEGAVGSEYKIDVTYLSQHVNMATFLEGETKKYGVPLLMSQWFVDALPLVSRSRCRRVDYVPATVGTEAMMVLWTFVFGDEDEALELVRSSEMTFELYLNGNWREARVEIELFAASYPNDGPSQALLKCMRECSYVCPWKRRKAPNRS